MMVARIYGLMCVLVMAGALTVYLTDSFNFATTMILGFIASVLAGTGMLTVYPALMKDDVPSERKASKRGIADQMRRKNCDVAV